MADRANPSAKGAELVRVLGIDPGIQRLGYAVLEIEGSEVTPLSYGLISTEPGIPKNDRLYQVYNDVETLIQKYTPQVMGLETLIFAKNTRTATIISEVRGALLVLGKIHNMDIVEFSPLQVKTAVCGYGRASKAQIQQAVRILLSLAETPSPDDVADAIAIALCSAHRR
jgi:crossover junction endodeoxyribonuclease RuvC